MRRTGPAIEAWMSNRLSLFPRVPADLVRPRRVQTRRRRIRDGGWCMPRGMGFGMGAGAVSVLAARLAVSPVVQGDVTVKSEKETKKSAEGSHTAKTDRRVRIVMGSGSHLGVRLEDVDKDDVSRLKLTEERGALIKGVDEDSPAARAGLKAGDVVVRYQGEAVQGVAQLSRLVRETP